MALPLPPLNLNTNQRSEQSGLTGGTASSSVVTGARIVKSGISPTVLIVALAVVAVVWLKRGK